MIHHPAIADFLPRIEKLLNRESVKAYREEGHEGVLRALQIAVHSQTGQLQLVFVCRSRLGKDEVELAPLRRALRSLNADGIVHSVWLNEQSAPTNALLGTRFERLYGPASLVDTCAGAEVHYPPGAFGQANPVLHEKAVKMIHEQVRPAARVLEYYAGVGTIGLGLLARGHEVIFNELGEGSLAGLHNSLEQLPDASSKVLEGKAGQYAAAYATQDTVIVDPPRKGLDKELLGAFLEEPPAQLIYLSCGFDSLKRECEQLRKDGRLALRSLTGFTYFPFTEHVETLAVFEKKV